jgi:hypothetical protein
MSDAQKRAEVPEQDEHFNWGKFFAGPTGKALLVIVVIAVIAGCVIAVIEMQRENRTAEAWEELAKAGMDIDKLNGLKARYEGLAVCAHVRYRIGVALCNGDPGTALPTKRKDAAAEFRAVFEQHPGSMLAPLARVQLGWIFEEQAEDLRASDPDAARAKLADAREAYYHVLSQSVGTFAAQVAQERYDRLQKADEETAETNG